MTQYAGTEDLIMNAALLGTVDPVSQGVGTVSTPWVPAHYFQGLVAVVQTGVLGAAATVDAKLQKAQDAAGTGAADIAGKAIAQIVKATGDNKQSVISLPRAQMDVNANPFVRLSITVGGAASLVAGSLLGVRSIYGGNPAALGAGVAEVVR